VSEQYDFVDRLLSIRLASEVQSTFCRSMALGGSKSAGHRQIARSRKCSHLTFAFGRRSMADAAS
jgi:hypothetical protein